MNLPAFLMVLVVCGGICTPPEPVPFEWDCDVVETTDA